MRSTMGEAVTAGMGLAPRPELSPLGRRGLLLAWNRVEDERS